MQENKEEDREGQKIRKEVEERERSRVMSWERGMRRKKGLMRQ